ncbi:MAG: PKD domain-containing protein, partial [Chitinophagaceae bacterium]
MRNADGIDEIERIDYITVFPSPTVNFSADITLGCVPVRVNFKDLSATTVGSIISWNWDFGDGTTSTLQNPAHSYTSTGFYTVTLTATSSSGCKRTVSKGRFIRVVDGVSTNFNFSLSRSCQAPFAVNFQNQSSGPGTITYAWNFGNGQTSTVRNPSTVYNTAGTYTVRLNAQS